jgi:hypothetical protein
MITKKSCTTVGHSDPTQSEQDITTTLVTNLHTSFADVNMSEKMKSALALYNRLDEHDEQAITPT